ncbi:haloacid dehalogenase [Fomitiporia mediterranea MF3/22]|uniref:haloacid dehalogenase n=1 Tax=Fomitiporia mediterranea (strain MF3/22) TaxID=694068 RepID=UPI00044095D1|nr:haloacid dehalogenase [Fomitiporia mediterranea MF3/22]EJD02361.1 haloacid dehalogenase [Fomitiporia mediterranea MF3/22]
MSSEVNPLKDVQALTFDVFGTVVDWHGSVVSELKQQAAKSASKEVNSYTEKDWSDFAKEWRMGYRTKTYERANGAKGSLNVDIMHREILEEMLSTERWSALKTAWNEADLAEINLAWHRLDGWPDSSNGLAQLKGKFIISTLTNGNVRLMVDMARHAKLPWDVILTAELLGSFKPNPITYRGALNHLSIKPEQCAMVAAHLFDLQAAAKEGMRTIYIRRPTEDAPETRQSIKAKKDGGEVDVVVDSFEELASVLGCNM